MVAGVLPPNVLPDVAAGVLVPDGTGVTTQANAQLRFPAWGDSVVMTIRSAHPNIVLHTSSYATFDDILSTRVDWLRVWQYQ